jgi:RimJ/RimL family protein N-acetyltransferase
MRLTTERLVLRPWRETDLPLVAEIAADPLVMRYFHLTRTRAQSDAWVARTQAHIDRHGFGVWAVEAPGVADLIGFTGLVHVPDEVPCAPAIEAAWTFGARWWRQGYCTEAAGEAMRDGFERLHFPEIVAFTTASNTPSQGVMRKLGMTRDLAGDFDHPRVPAGHALAPHVLYRRKNPLEQAA